MGSSVKRLAILGSTGSIGQQTLDVIRAFPDRFQIVGLAAGQNTALLNRQIDEFKPKFICSEKREPHFPGSGYKRLSLEDMASHPEVDLVVIAASGKAGLSPTLAAVRAGKTVALANKESLVTAGEIITTEAERHGARILPVDSEHSAIWQCLRGETQTPTQIILTASG
ncbi:MAG: 1-deoxy-D-xylulose-5-phosphate reductoisomerase, partial [Dehalococcoidales bacterium]|nr:1-deoxy-D-xylulose-5-phosphate reductoisomerase [Dehalococcoidales bacterium]